MRSDLLLHKQWANVIPLLNIVSMFCWSFSLTLCHRSTSSCLTILEYVSIVLLFILYLLFLVLFFSSVHSLLTRSLFLVGWLHSFVAHSILVHGVLRVNQIQSTWASTKTTTKRETLRKKRKKENKCTPFFFSKQCLSHDCKFLMQLHPFRRLHGSYFP